MCKKKGNKKFAVCVQVPEWNHGCTAVLRYRESVLYVWAKSPVKAVAKITDKHAILRIEKCNG